MQLYIRSNLAYVRAARGNLSQKKIAQATGIGQKTLSALETGTSQGIEFKTLAKLCTYLRCTPSDLLVMEEEADYTPVTKKALLKADKLISKAKRAAKKAPGRAPQDVWAEFDRVRLRMQGSAAQVESRATSKKRVAS